MLPFLSKEVNYETKSGALLYTCFADLLCGGCFFRLPEEYAPTLTYQEREDGCNDSENRGWFLR